METGLVTLDAFQRALSEASTIPETKNLLDQADLFRQWLRKQKAGREAINAGAEMMLRAERQLGKMLIQQIKPGNPQLSQVATISLSTLNINRSQSSRWQTEAAIPDELFEEYLNFTKSLQDELSYITREGLLRFYVKRRTSEENVIPLPTGVFNVIYCDPPWKYNNQIESWGPTTGREKIMHYTGLDFEKISWYTDKNGREIKECFAEDAVLFLWVTNPFLSEGLTLTSNWGFDYKTNIVWVKTNLKRPGSGFWVRGRHELLYIASRGSFLPEQKGKAPIGSVVDWDDTLLSNQEQHSKKPDAVYDLIESLFPEAKYLELYARKKRPNWESWGNQIETNST